MLALRPLFGASVLSVWEPLSGNVFLLVRQSVKPAKAAARAWAGRISPRPTGWPGAVSDPACGVAVGGLAAPAP